jgi:hypothetical protein
MPTNTPDLSGIPGIQLQVGNSVITQDAAETTPATADGQAAFHWLDVGPGVGCRNFAGGTPFGFMPLYDTAGPNTLTGCRFSGSAGGTLNRIQIASYAGDDTDFAVWTLIKASATQDAGASLVGKDWANGFALLSGTDGKDVLLYIRGVLANTITLPDNNPHVVLAGRSGSTYFLTWDGEANQLTGACSPTAFSSARNITIGGNFNGVSGSPDSLYTGAIYTTVYVSAWPSATDRRKVWDWHSNVSALTFTGLPSAGGYRRRRGFDGGFSDMTGGF